MEDILLIQAIERYLDGTMLPAEKAYFEQLRKNTPEIDQMVVEHSMFLAQMDAFADRQQFKQALHQSHQKLMEKGEINEGSAIHTKGKIVMLWNRYKKVTAIAASVAGAIAIITSAMFAYFSPAVNVSQLQQLSKDIEVIKRNQQVQGSLINEVKSKLPENARLISGGTGFLIDTKGYLVTNAHVLRGSGAIVVNNKGQEFTASIVNINPAVDLAILKINDKDYQPLKYLPYSIAKKTGDLGEEIFTLGYPRNEIVYTQGYLSAKTGFDGDTLSTQIQMNSNPGNSGGPVLNKKGEVIGILSTRQTHADGITFAIKSKNIYSLVNHLNNNDSEKNITKIKLPLKSYIANNNREEQVKKMEDCVFLVKAYNN
ncbi:MAG: serine protease [Hydrotalea flava]|uniref:S1C family serine protease n=1 Tax=Hydrotalea TaxID=1004300 RepID=UPI0010252B2D|nr:MULTISPECIES: serine protease [Hydrotalea]MBY0349237.1 serine protease [Hydrotalea flava]RWZ90278.1 MAG: serine protease [Hydrotalea sp. AMD]